MKFAPVAEPPRPLAVVRDRIRRTLAASAEFRALPLERQDHLIRDMVHAGAAAARAIAQRQDGDPARDDSVRAESVSSGAAAAELVESVDFPTFVTGLIEGTFEAIVDASIRQMRAYTELLGSIAKPVEEFMRDNVVDEDDRDDRDDLVADPRDDDGSRRRTAADRQQLLATMVLMGINRIVVTDGRINAAVTYELRSPP